jgi:hypothetical protein
VDIASASGTRRPGLESRQGIRFLGKHNSALEYKMTYVVCFVCEFKGEIKTKIYFEKICYGRLVKLYHFGTLYQEKSATLQGTKN